MERGDIKVSVIIPVYNAEKYLRQCLDSVVNQTLKEIEIICVDDGSTDKSLEILREYEAEDSRVCVLTQENQGAGAARNKGMDIARGESLSILDSDDFFEKEMLEKAYYGLQSTAADIAIFKVRFFDNSTCKYENCNWAIRKNLLPKEAVFSSDEVASHIFQFCNGWAWDKLFRRSFIEKNHLRFQNTRIFNDAYFVFSSLLCSRRITIVADVLATKRRSVETSISSSRSENWKEFSRVIEKIHDQLLKVDTTGKYAQSFLNYALHLALYVYRTIDPASQGEMIKYLKTEYFPYYKFEDYEADFYYDKQNYQLFLDLLTSTDDKDCKTLKSGSLTIPIVYAADENYIRYTATSMESALRHRKRDDIYEFYILIPDELNEKSKEVLREIVNSYPKANISFMYNAANLKIEVSCIFAV